MIKFLNDIRNVEKTISNNRKIINTIAVLFLGIALGTFSKFLDFRQAELPSVLMAIDGALDVHNFLGRFAIWVLIALCISIYSNSAIRASVNVFAFFVGMLIGYYVWTSVFAGFYPDIPYLMRWLILAVVSPFLAFLIWYARGRGALAIGISSVLIPIYCCFAFNLNFADFRILYFPEFILWLASIGILFKDVKQSAFSLLISIPVALSLEYTGLLGIIGIG